MTLRPLGEYTATIVGKRGWWKWTITYRSEWAYSQSGYAFTIRGARKKAWDAIWRDKMRHESPPRDPPYVYTGWELQEWMENDL